MVGLMDLILMRLIWLIWIFLFSIIKVKFNLRLTTVITDDINIIGQIYEHREIE